LGCCQRLEAEYRADDPLYAVMVLLHDGVELFHLSDDAGSLVLFLVAFNSDYIGLAPIDGDHLGEIVPRTEILRSRRACL